MLASPEGRHDLYRLLVESVTDYAIFALDRDGNVLNWNAGAERLNGYQAHQIIGRHFSAFYPDEAALRGYPAFELREAARDGRYEDEGWRVRRNGSRFWANVVITAMRNRNGELLGFAKITRDLTARRQAEEMGRRLAAESASLAESVRRSNELSVLTRELREQAVELEAQRQEAQSLTVDLAQANRRLQAALHDTELARISAETAHLEARSAAHQAAEANQAKYSFLAMMSHELRTPLNAIAGYAELVSTGVYGPVSEQQKSALARLQSSQRSLLALINNLLNFVRLESGEVSATLEPVAVAALFERLAEMTDRMPGTRNLSLEFQQPEVPLVVRTDPDKALQVLMNLLSNAIRFTPDDGAIRLEAARMDSHVAIRVMDTGVGIEHERLEKLFEPFVTLSSDYSSPREGTGLSLAISRDLALLLEGELLAESEPGKGSVFTLMLPAAPDPGARPDLPLP